VARESRPGIVSTMNAALSCMPFFNHGNNKEKDLSVDMSQNTGFLAITDHQIGCELYLNKVTLQTYQQCR